MTTLADLRHALAAIDRVLAENEPRHRGAWRRQSAYIHVAHARAHCDVWTETRQREDLEHALVRLLMAVELALGGEGGRPS